MAYAVSVVNAPLSRHGIEARRCLGVNARAAVFTGWTSRKDDNTSPEPVLIKASPITNDSFRELGVHRELAGGHPSILPLVSTIHEDSEVFLITRDPGYGTLHDAITARRLFRNNTTLIKKTFNELLDVVAYCHEQGLAHRDLTPRNIVLANDDGSKIYLTNFSTTSPKTVIYGEYDVGTRAYASPGTQKK
jgi:serine/threonine protein kinase